MVIQNFLISSSFSFIKFSIQSSNFSNSVSSCHSSGGISGKKTPKFSFSFVRRKPACLRHRSSLSGCRFGRSGSSGFVVSFRRLRLTSRGLAPRVHSFRDRCRYRYICRPKRSGFHLRDCLKGGNCLRSARTLRWD